MCGVFGYIANRNSTKGPDVARLRDIALATMTRGAHAFGFAWVDDRGTLRMFKQAGRIADHLGVLGMVRGARLVVGHCRYATAGHPSDNQNNHPHPANGGWFVHNGRIPEYRELVRHFGLHPVTGCDSEVLGLLAEQADGNDADRLLAAVGATDEGPLVALGVWGRPRRLVAIRRGHPLHAGIRGGACYLASLPHGLPGQVSPLPDRTMLDFTAKGVRHEAF